MIICIEEKIRRYMRSVLLIKFAVFDQWQQKREIVLSLFYFCLSYFPKVTPIDQKKIELKRLLMNQTLPTKVFSFFKKLELHLLGIKILKLFCQLLAYGTR